VSATDDFQSYAQSFVDGLIDGGVGNVVICPGSRSTPLALAFIERVDSVRPWVLYDERSAAFFALGMAKSSAAPIALLCTSGTAAANFLPAVAEASLGRVPIVAVTADRPPESRDFGGAQTIDQVGLFTTHVKWKQDMSVAANLPSLVRYARLVGVRAADTARSVPRGPVQVNFPFREPLVSESKAMMTTPGSDERHGRALTVVRREARADQVELHRVADRLRSLKRGVIVVGPGEYGTVVREELSSLSVRLGWPLLVDVLSNLRQDGALGSGLVRGYEFLVRSTRFKEVNRLDCVLRVGGVPTSKELNSLCQGAAETILLDDSNGWRDPDFMASTMVFGDLEHSLSCLNRSLEGGGESYSNEGEGAMAKTTIDATNTSSISNDAAAAATTAAAAGDAAIHVDDRPDGAWLRGWLDADSRVQSKMQALMESPAMVDELFEGKLFYLLSTELNPSAPLTVIVGSSMPVRDLDSFFLRGSKNIRFMANRGANGIDGVVSTAMGVSAVEGDVLLILGDVSFYHDMNGLLASKLQKLNAMIIVINNRGGGIFSFLAQHGLPQPIFEKLFGEAHELDFSGVRLLYGGDFLRVGDWASFRSGFADYTKRRGLRVMELVAPDRERNLEIHRMAFEALSNATVEPEEVSARGEAERVR
jgi:2-succinyl-5-enolpyruvyl-6-hydroxy-3-cyclohexene-1-carboxylate synthase